MSLAETSHLLDFFAVVGSKFPLTAEEKYQVQPPITYRSIINIFIYMPSYGDNLKDIKNCTIIDKTFYGKSGSLSSGELVGPKIYLAYERESYEEANGRSMVRKNLQKKKEDRETLTSSTATTLPRPALTNIKLIHPGESHLLTGDDWQLLTTNVNGNRPGNVNTGVSGKALYFAYQRENLNSEYKSTKKQEKKKRKRSREWKRRPRIIDLCIIDMSKHERVPFGYVMLEKSLNSTCWRGGHSLHLCKC
jgi:hypothetical protein